MVPITLERHLLSFLESIQPQYVGPSQGPQARHWAIENDYALLRYLINVEFSGSVALPIFSRNHPYTRFRGQRITNVQRRTDRGSQ